MEGPGFDSIKARSLNPGLPLDEWEFQDLKWYFNILEPCKAIFCGDIALHSPEFRLYMWQVPLI